jgi:hypothetical protein
MPTLAWRKPMPLIRGHHSFDDHFTQIPNDWVRDSRLSLKAIGLLTQLMSHRPGWNMSISSLARFNKTGVDTIKSAVKELELNGYLHRSEKQEHNNDGTFADYVWTTADPFQNPATVKPADGKQDIKNTITKEQQVKKNKQENKASKITDDWKPSEKLVEEYPAKYPGLNYDKELAKFINYYTSKAESRKDWNASYRNWLINAMDYQGIKPEEQNKPLQKLKIGKWHE